MAKRSPDDGVQKQTTASSICFASLLELLYIFTFLFRSCSPSNGVRFALLCTDFHCISHPYGITTMSNQLQKLPVPGPAIDSSTAPDDAHATPSTVTVENRKGSPKSAANDPFLHLPFQPLPAHNSQSSETFFLHRSLYSADNDNERRTGRLLMDAAGPRLSSGSPAPPITWKGKGIVFWTENKGLALVCLSQLFGVMMNVTTRLLEMDGNHGPGMHPFQVCPAPLILHFSFCHLLIVTQILFARMTGTLILSCTYQWWAEVDSAPFGPRGVWLLLIARGVGGFFGGKDVFGLSDGE